MEYALLKLGLSHRLKCFHKLWVLKKGLYKTNDFSTPLFLLKEGIALEKAGDYAGALKSYEQIDREYPNSSEARDIEKYIERAEMSMRK